MERKTAGERETSFAQENKKLNSAPKTSTFGKEQRCNLE